MATPSPRGSAGLAQRAAAEHRHAYPGLMRLEQRGLIKGEWSVTDTNRKARFYAITAAGRRQLAKEKADWERMASIMQSVLQAQP